MRRAVLLFLGLLVGGAVVLFFLSGNTDRAPPMPAPPPALVEVATAVRRPVAVTVQSVGTVEAAERVSITAQVTGKVASILFEEGQRVKAGDTLVQLDAERERATLRAAQADWREAGRQVRRLTELRAAKAVSQADLDEARARYDAAQARVGEAQADLAYRRIAAPFGGVVGLRQVSPGALVEPGTAITTLATVERLKLRFELPSSLLPRLRPGLEVEARAAGFDRSFTGRITRIDNTVDPATRSIALEAEIPNARLLAPGVFVTVRVILERRDAVVVPEEAIVLEGDQSFVYRIGPDGAVARQAITVGERRGGLAEVRAGLTAGDQVITAGVQKVREGQRVRLRGQQERAPAPANRP